MYVLTSLIILRFVSFFYPCFCIAIQVSLDTRLLVNLHNINSTKSTFSLHFVFRLFGSFVQVTFYLYKHSKFKWKSRIILMLHSMYSFCENYTVFGKNNPCQTSKQPLKTKEFVFTFLNLNSNTFEDILCNEFSLHKICTAVLWVAKKVLTSFWFCEFYITTAKSHKVYTVKISYIKIYSLASDIVMLCFFNDNWVKIDCII